MKVYVTYDPLYEKVLCVHQYYDTECPDCKTIREERNKLGRYHLEEIEKVVYNNAKTYDSPAILNHTEENIVNSDEEDLEPEMKFYNPKSGKMEKLFDETKMKKGDE